MDNYIQWIRSKVGTAPLILTAAAGIIFNERKEVLLIHRIEKKGQWALPAGYLELYETPQQAAEREVFEETGLIVKVHELLGVYTMKDTYDNGDEVWIVGLPFICKPLSGELKADEKEVSEVRYFSLSHLPKNLRDRDILSDLKRRTLI